MKSTVRFLAHAVRRGPWVVLAVTLILSAVFASLSGQAEVAQGNEGFAPDNAEIRASERIGELFGGDAQESVVQVMIRSSDRSDVITAEGLRVVEQVTAAIQESGAADSLVATPRRPAVVSYLAPVQRVVEMQGIDPAGLDDAAVDQIYGQALDAPAAADQAGFLTALLADGADPATATAPGGLILVFVEQQDGEGADEAFDAQIAVEQAIADAASSVAAPEGIEIRPFSFSLLFGDDFDFTAEVGRLFGFAAAIILVILGFVYWLTPLRSGRWVSIRRTITDMLLTLFTIFAAISWMQGIGVLLERGGIVGSFNPVTQIIPILLVGLGVDYGIHLTTRYREEIGEGRSVDEAIGRAIGTVGVALVLATITTAIGFLTNVFNPVPALKDFGILSAVGIVVSFLLMLTFVPAVREVLDRRAERGERLPRAAMASTSERLLPRLIERASVLAERVPVPTLVVALVLGVLGVWGLANLETRFSFTDFLPDDAPAVQNLRVLQEEFGGGLGETSHVLIEAEEGVDLATPTVHNALVAADDGLTSVEHVVTFETSVGEVASSEAPLSVLRNLLAGGAGSAPADVLAAAQRAGLQPDLSVAPDGDVRGLWSALLAAAPDDAGSVLHVSEEGRFDAVLFAVQTQAGEAGAGELREGLVDAFAPVADVDGVSAIPTSQNIISDVIVDALASSQTRSLLITLVIATLVLAISFWFENRRPMLGVLTMLPVALVVFWTYGLMYATGIPFGPVTATLAALAVGIGVPFTIHIARRFEEDRVRFADLEDALRSTTRHTGGALAGSAFTTMAGFGILVSSTLTPFQQMGQVTVYAIGLSLVGAILVLPSLLALWEGWHKRRGTAAPEKKTASVL